MAAEIIPESHMNVGATIVEIDTEFIERTLRRSEKDDKLTIDSYTTTPLTKKGDNYTSYILGVDATVSLGGNGVKKDFHLVAKLAPSNDVRRQFAEMMQIFPKENFMYNTFVPSLIALQKDRGVTDVVIPPIPKIYSPPDEKETVLMFENVCADGYKMAEKLEGCSYKQAELVMVELGRFHALSHAFVEEHKKNHPGVPITTTYPLLEDAFKHEQFKEQGNMFMTQSVDNSVKLILPVIEKRGDSDLVEKLNKYLGNGGTRLEELLDRRDGLVAIIHGDCWINNMMFKFEKDEAVAVKLLDLQISRLAGCALELNYFVYTSIGKKVRDSHLKDLLAIYHRELQATWKKINEKVEYTLEDLHQDFHSYKVGGFIYSLMALPLMLARPEEAFDMDGFKEEDMNDMEAMKLMMESSSSKMSQNEFFITRLTDVVDEMNRDDVL